jgi:hypothetical protein
MSKIFLSLPRSIVAIRQVSRLVSTFKNKKASEHLSMTLLLPDNKEHEKHFLNILGDENVTFSSSWINDRFNLDKVKKFVHRFVTKLSYLEDGDTDIHFPSIILEQRRQGLSPTQVALNTFFSTEENQKKFEEMYLSITERAYETGLGYFVFKKSDQSIIGGGGLVPVSSGIPVIRADIGLHIKVKRSGFGEQCFDQLLHYGFIERDLKEIVGSSLPDTEGTKAISSNFAMRRFEIKDNKLGYYISRESYDAIRAIGEERWAEIAQLAKGSRGLL